MNTTTAPDTVNASDTAKIAPARQKTLASAAVNIDLSLQATDKLSDTGNLNPSEIRCKRSSAFGEEQVPPNEITVCVKG